MPQMPADRPMAVPMMSTEGIIRPDQEIETADLPW